MRGTRDHENLVTVTVEGGHHIARCDRCREIVWGGPDWTDETVRALHPIYLAHRAEMCQPSEDK